MFTFLSQKCFLFEQTQKSQNNLYQYNQTDLLLYFDERLAKPDFVRKITSLICIPISNPKLFKTC